MSQWQSVLKEIPSNPLAGQRVVRGDVSLEHQPAASPGIPLSWHEALGSENSYFQEQNYSPASRIASLKAKILDHRFGSVAAPPPCNQGGVTEPLTPQFSKLSMKSKPTVQAHTAYAQQVQHFEGDCPAPYPTSAGLRYPVPRGTATDPRAALGSLRTTCQRQKRPSRAE